MFEFTSKKIADIKILHEGYTADYFPNRMKPNALFPILFIQNNLFLKKHIVFIKLLITQIIIYLSSILLKFEQFKYLHVKLQFW
jgi:hypothetical protein